MSIPRLTAPQLILLADALKYGRVTCFDHELLTARSLRRRGLMTHVADRVYAPAAGAQEVFDAQARFSR